MPQPPPKDKRLASSRTQLQRRYPFHVIIQRVAGQLAIPIEDNVDICYNYSIGKRCWAREDGNECRFKHVLELRREVVKEIEKVEIHKSVIGATDKVDLNAYTTKAMAPAESLEIIDKKLSSKPSEKLEQATKIIEKSQQPSKPIVPQSTLRITSKPVPTSSKDIDCTTAQALKAPRVTMSKAARNSTDNAAPEKLQTGPGEMKTINTLKNNSSTMTVPAKKKRKQKRNKKPESAVQEEKSHPKDYNPAWQWQTEPIDDVSASIVVENWTEGNFIRHGATDSLAHFPSLGSAQSKKPINPASTGLALSFSTKLCPSTKPPTSRAFPPLLTKQSTKSPKSEFSAFSVSKSESVWSSPPISPRKPVVKLPPGQHKKSTEVHIDYGAEALLQWAEGNIRGTVYETAFKKNFDFLKKGKLPRDLLASYGQRAPADSLFKYFALLPFELREMIFAFAIDAEYLELRLKFTYKSCKVLRNQHNEVIDSYFDRPQLIPQTVGPKFLHVNRQSRALALTRFERAFGTINRFEDHRIDAQKARAARNMTPEARQLAEAQKFNPPHPGTFFNFSHDRVFFHTSLPNEMLHIVPHLNPLDRNRLTHIVLPLRDFAFGKERLLAQQIAKFKALHTLTLVVGDGREDRSCIDPEREVKLIAGTVKYWWIDAGVRARPPLCKLEIISALKAHVMKIDEFKW